MGSPWPAPSIDMPRVGLKPLFGRAEKGGGKFCQPQHDSAGFTTGNLLPWGMTLSNMSGQLICAGCGYSAGPAEAVCTSCGRPLRVSKRDGLASPFLPTVKNAWKMLSSSSFRHRLVPVALLVVVVIAMVGHPPTGTESGAYTLDVPSGYSTPITPQKPTQAQFSHRLNGDLWVSNSGIIQPVNNDELSAVLSAKPTYRLCSGRTGFAAHLRIIPGTRFCLRESRSHLIIGVTIVAFRLARPSFVTLRITVWQARQRA